MVHEERKEPEVAPPPRRAQAWRSWLGRVALEAGLIVFSLLLALWLSGLEEARETEAAVAQTRAALVAELRANRAIVQADYHLAHQETLMTSLVQTLDSARSMEELREGALTAYQMGVHPPELHDAAWRAASTTGILQHMDPAEVFALSTVYSAQEAQTRLVTAYYPHVLLLATYEDDETRLRGAMSGVATFLGDLTASERMIARRQEQALIAMGEDPDAPADPALVTQEY